MELRVKLVSIPVRDQERAVRFYTTRLGGRVTTDQPYDGGHRWIEVTLPGGGTRLVLFAAEGEAAERVGRISDIVFTSRDIEATYHELLARGVEFVQPLREEPWGMSCVFRDPDGNKFALTSDVEAGVADDRLYPGP